MYTTLEFLKENEACKDGYGEMTSFFGVSPKIKKVKIPLSVCALAISEEHLNWLVENAAIIDRQEYEAFRKRWVLPLMHTIMWRDVPKKNDKRYKTYVEFASAKTSEEVEALIEADRFKMRNEIEMTHNDYWWHAGRFVEVVLENWKGTLHYRHRDFRDEASHELREGMAPLPPRASNNCCYYFSLPERHPAYLFSTDPYGDAAKFLMEHGAYMPHKKLKITPPVGDQPVKAALQISGAREVVQMAKFLADTRATRSEVSVPTSINLDGPDDEAEDGEDDGED